MLLSHNNLIVQDGIDCIRSYIENIRSTLLFIQTLAKIYQEFRYLCSKNGIRPIRPKKFKLHIQYI